MEDGDEPPIRLCKQSEKLGILLLRALNRNQRLILSAVKKGHNETITSILVRINKEHKIPLSTLKLNSRILRNLGLIEFGTNSDFRPAKMTKDGTEVLGIISRSSLTAAGRSKGTSVCSKAAGCKPADLDSISSSETE